MNIENKRIADEILRQLGGNRFITMVGAKNLCYSGPNLSFKFSGSKAANYMKIELTPMDTYTVTFGKLGKEFKVTETHENIYCDGLQELFTSVTKLNTHL